MSKGKSKKADHFDDEGRKLRSQHSIFGPVRRVAGPPGNTPRWAESVARSWNRYERKDAMRRAKGESEAAGSIFELDATG